ncbi:PREDICTED: transcription factor bHLH93-like isoform X3 [Lupinus angustifolius]|uniref:transcription factor bHLH93-like isoform X3 n=1 Tax=Lupinus angustifolius TaxID=3871 RepID=UPI00092E336F|nr:PREDICTED: transcription factor bHLH93-like isoform X3 [Lupinus angustifolius]
MEFYDNDFLEELMALRRETFNTNPSIEENEFFSNGYSFDCFEQNSSTFLLNNTLCGQEFPQSYNNEYNTFNEINGSLLDEPSAFQILDSYHNTLDTPLNTTSFLGQEDFSFSMIEGEDNTCFLGEELQNLELQNTCKMEPTLSPEMAVFNIGTGLERKNRSKKLQGQPSKNLMAERRRRKRLNDRLSMLRSIVPKISKFEVERNLDTRVEICCVGKPGLLLSTVNTLEALGLEIQQCVISCFNDFSMQASCSEELEQRTMLSSEDIKQALFRSAGYGGKCL